MVKLRLFRTGKRHQPHYRLVAMESEQKRDGKVLEILGFWQPKNQPPLFRYKKERVQYWLNHGAQPTPVVRQLLKENPSGGKKKSVHKKSKKP